jgi:hypothetical protein
VALELLTVVLMLAVGLVQVREGIFGAAVLLLNVILAGLVAFNFWEPLADLVGSPSRLLDSYADAVCLVFLFVVTLGLLRLLTSYLTPNELWFPPIVRQLGGPLVGLVAGYLLAGILICVFQTLPWHERFLWYDPDEGMGLGAPDRVWLAIVHRASGKVFDYGAGEEKWFDADGSFIPRYARYRRYRDGKDEPLPNQGDFPTTLGTERPPVQAERGPPE